MTQEGGQEPIGEIRTIGAFLDLCFRLTATWTNLAEGKMPSLWYRGQPRASDQLVPSLYRKGPVTQDFAALDAEAWCFEQFKRLGPAYTERPPATDMGWYALMRHHDGLTRHLDWSESALVALYFAIAEGFTDDDAAVWVLDPAWLNVQTIGQAGVPHETPFLELPYDPVSVLTSSSPPDRPVAFSPTAVSPRIVAQKSGFTIHGTDERPLEEQTREWAEAEGDGGSLPRLVRLVIPSLARPGLCYQLRTAAGLTASSVYPDLDGLMGELTAFRWPFMPSSLSAERAAHAPADGGQAEA